MQSSIGSWLWLARNYAPFRGYLQKRHGIRDVVPIWTSRWHRGASYFRALAENGESLFIKTDGIYRLLENEVDAWNQLQTLSAERNRFARVRFYDFIDKYRFVGFDWVNGEPLSTFLVRKRTDDQIAFIAAEIVGVLEDLRRADIVHRDFTPENLLVALDHAGRPTGIILIDFAFAVTNKAAPLDRFVPRSELQVLCHGYKAKELTWDDAYSCLMILELIERTTGVKDAALHARVASRLGAHIFSLDPEAVNDTRAKTF